MIQADTLKPGWSWVKFGDVVRLSKDRAANPEAEGIERYVGLEHIDPDDLRIRRWGLVAEGITFTSRFKPGQVLFGKRRAYQRKVAIADFEGVCSGDIYVFESANPKVLLPELLPFICQTDRFFDHAVGTSAGSLSPRTNWTSLANFEFALPPLEEQRQLVNILSKIDYTLESLQAVAQQATNLQDAYILEKIKHISQASPNILLNDIADVQYGLTVNAKRRNTIVQAPYLRVANVQRGSLDLSEIKLIGKLDGDDAFILQKGDVLIVEGHADANEVGRSAIWTDENTEMLHQNHLIRVRCQPSVCSEYLCAFLNSSIGRCYFRANAKSTSGLNTLNSTVVKNIKVPLPSLREQKHTIQILTTFCQAISFTIERTEKLKNIRRNSLLNMGKN
ncbi:restriction endonuclease subunit S [Scytonema sp. PRP1]|uniref:restriction endonuclease subunit S n=1 Tax=Scytonema sp. PRP1 TaxID=3120513 RepID=UPI002FD33C1B